MKKVFCLLLLFLVFTATACSAITIDELFTKLQANKTKITDMQADIITKMTSSMKGMQGMEQKGHIWTKGSDKSKMEISSPMRQTTITNGDKMAVIMPDTGQKHVQDLSKTAGPQDSKTAGQMDLEKAKEKFDFSVKEQSGGYLITGYPKDNNKFMGKMEIFVDSSMMVPAKIKMFNPAGQVLSETQIEYKQISGVYVVYRNTSKISLPNGKMTMEMGYSEIKVNEGIKDEEFEI